MQLAIEEANGTPWTLNTSTSWQLLRMLDLAATCIDTLARVLDHSSVCLMGPEAWC